ncbi:MAG: ExbD/TolR family protein [Planctomycetota bacterium]|jgi:hypothetical protein
MPSKRLTLLILLVIVGGVAGLSRIEPQKTRAGVVPPELLRFISAHTGARMGGEPAKPDPGSPDTGLDTPPPEDDGPVDVRITDLNLQGLSVAVTKPVEDPGTGDFAVIRIGAEGELRWGGINAGSYDMIAKLFKENYQLYGDDFQAIITPDQSAPWQYLYWTIECAREAGLKKVGLGVTPGTDEEGTLLAMYELQLPVGEVKLPEEMVQLEVEIKVGDGDLPAYDVFGQKAKSRQELFAKCSSFNGDYADEFGGDYARDASKTPWVIVAPPLMDSGTVLRALEALRLAAVYTVRFGGEFPTRPGKKR